MPARLVRGVMKPSEADQMAANQLHLQIQTLCAGNTAAVVLMALCQSSAAAIGFSSPSPQRAAHLVDSFGKDMKRQIRENWDYLLQVKAQATIQTPEKAN